MDRTEDPKRAIESDAEERRDAPSSQVSRDLDLLADFLLDLHLSRHRHGAKDSPASFDTSDPRRVA